MNLPRPLLVRVHSPREGAFCLTMKPIVFVDVDNTLFDLIGKISSLSHILPVPFAFPEPPRRYETPWESWVYHADDKLYGPNDDLCEAIIHLGHEDALAVLDLLGEGDYKAAQRDPKLARKIFDETAKKVWWWAVRQVHELMWRAPELVEPYPGAPEAIESISQRARVVITTTRSYQHYPCAYPPNNWVKHWFGRYYTAVLGTSRAIKPWGEIVSLASEYGANKWDPEERTYGTVVVVNDDPYLLAEIAKLQGKRFGIRGSLHLFSLRKPWAHQLPDGVVLAEDWEELAQKVLGVLE